VWTEHTDHSWRQTVAVEEFRECRLYLPLDMTHPLDAARRHRRSHVLPRLEPVRRAADPEVDEVASIESMEAIERVTPRDPSRVLVVIAGRGDHERDSRASGEIDRVTAIRHHKPIGDAVRVRHRCEAAR
jgi:hypothetical protein